MIDETRATIMRLAVSHRTQPDETCSCERPKPVVEGKTTGFVLSKEDVPHGPIVGYL